MGKYKFSLSDMVPNSWFYKLRDMGHNRRKNKNFSIRDGLARKSFTSPASSPRVSFVPYRYRASYYYSSNSTAVIAARRNPNSLVNLARRLDADLPLESPRKSKKKNPRRHLKVLINSPSRKPVSPSTSVRCNCFDSRAEHSIDATTNYETVISDSEKGTGFTDIIIDTNTKNSNSKRLANTRNSSKFIELELSPIRTRSDKEFKGNNDHSFNVENKTPYLRMKRASKSVYPFRTQVVSPKVPTKNVTKEKKLSKDHIKSVAVIKDSSDPQRDFTESMIEMIIVNNLRSSSDLEDLLACYLSLNSADYHSVIVKVFKQVWLDLNRLRIIE